MKKTFTLVELLVVIFIIGVLAGITIPAVNMAMRSAQRTACGANLRQIGNACIAFAGENNGALPAHQRASGNEYRVSSTYSAANSLPNMLRRVGRSTPDWKAPESSDFGTGVTADDYRIDLQANRRHWTTGILPKLNYDAKAFFCPSSRNVQKPFAFTSADSAVGSSSASYSMNFGSVRRPGGVANAARGALLTSAKNPPSGIILIAETPGGKIGVNTTNTNFRTATVAGTTIANDPHKGSYNIALLDGSCKAIPVAEFHRIVLSTESHPSPAPYTFEMRNDPSGGTP